MSGPLCDWMAAVMRGCRSLALMVSSVTSAPRAFEASVICFFSSTSQAGMKSTQRVMCSFVPCAKAGARWAARMPAMPVSFRNERRLIAPSSALVDLLQLALGPRHRVLGLGARDRLGEHVDDDVLGVRLVRLGGGRAGVAQHQRLARRLPEHLQRLVDLGPHRVLFPLLGGADRIAFVDLEPLAVVRVLMQPPEEVLGQLLVLAVLHDRVLEGAVEGELSGRPLRQERLMLDVLPERLTLVVLDLVLLPLGDDVDRGAVEGGADLAGVEGPVVVGIVPGEPTLVAGILPE